MSDEELRELQRIAAQTGDPADQLRYERALIRAGFPSWYPWRILSAPPNVEPYDWAPTVNAWLTGSDTATHAEDLLFEFAMGFSNPTRIVIRKTSIEEGLELSAGWLADNQPGFLHQPEYPTTEGGLCSECGANPQEDWCEHFQAAEADMVYTESGYLLSEEWAVTTLDSLQTLVSMLSRAIPIGEYDENLENHSLLVVLGAFWDVQTIYPTRFQAYFPPHWSEDEIREAVDTEIPAGQTLFVTEPDFDEASVYACWFEEGDEPLGEDAEIYCTAWEIVNFYSYPMQTSEDLWVRAAEQLLSEITRFKSSN